MGGDVGGADGRVVCSCLGGGVWIRDWRVRQIDGVYGVLNGDAADAEVTANEMLHVGGYVHDSQCEEAIVCHLTSSDRTVKRTGSETMGVLTCRLISYYKRLSK